MRITDNVYLKKNPDGSFKFFHKENGSIVWEKHFPAAQLNAVLAVKDEELEAEDKTIEEKLIAIEALEAGK